MRDPLRHHREHRAGGLFGNHWSEKLVSAVAEGIGTTAFLIGALVVIFLWVAINGGYGFFSGALRDLEHGRAFDPAPWILLNLIFSFEAFFTGSLVIIAAKSQAKRDRAREEADAKHREEIAAENLRELRVNTQLTTDVHMLAQKIGWHLASK